MSSTSLLPSPTPTSTQESTTATHTTVPTSSSTATSSQTPESHEGIPPNDISAISLAFGVVTELPLPIPTKATTAKSSDGSSTSEAATPTATASISESSPPFFRNTPAIALVFTIVGLLCALIAVVLFNKTYRRHISRRVKALVTKNRASPSFRQRGSAERRSGGSVWSSVEVVCSTLDRSTSPAVSQELPIRNTVTSQTAATRSPGSLPPEYASR